MPTEERTGGQRNKANHGPPRRITANRGAAARPPVHARPAAAGGANRAALDGGSIQRVAADDSFNYCRKYKICSRRFYDFLESNPAYEAQLHATNGMNDRHRTSQPYSIHISYEDMWQFDADVDLIRDTCNSRTDLESWLLPAARKFVRKFLSDNGNTNVETIINGTFLSFCGFPESMQMLQDFRKTDALVQRVPVFKGKASVLDPTFHGRRFMEILIVGISANHSNHISWGGEFSEENILIIKWRSKGDHKKYTYEMKMLQKPVEEGLDLHEAMVKDLLKVAAIFKPLYKVGQDWPVYFAELIEELEAVTTFSVGRPGFIEYLSYHPAIMLSAARKSFLMMLRDDIRKLGCHKLPASLSKPIAYSDWTAIVRSESKALNILSAVYSHVGTNPYTNTARDLIYFLRNICQHVKQESLYESELYSAQLFSRFLPSIMRILLQSGDMQTLFGETWSTYKRLC